MEQIIEFAITVILISASGVMSPGPLFVANVSYGLHGGLKTGIKIAFGHLIIEFPLVLLIGVGILSAEIFSQFRDVISFIGAIMLFAYASIQIKMTLQKKELRFFKSKSNPIVIGITLSALNPFLIIWWLSIGFKLVSDAVSIWAFEGILIVFLFHIWMDFAWLGTVSFLTSKSSKIFSNKNYKVLMVGLSCVLIYFGISFLLEIF